MPASRLFIRQPLHTSPTAYRRAAKSTNTPSHPRLNPSSLAHIRPWYQGRDQHSRETASLAFRVSTFLNLIDPHVDASAVEVIQAYQNLVEIDADALSPCQISRFIEILSLKPSRPLRETLLLVKSLLAHLRRAEDGPTSVEAQQKRELLSQPKTQTALLKLIDRSLKKVSQKELRDALQLLSSRDPEKRVEVTATTSRASSSPSRATWNALLGLLVKSIRVSLNREAEFGTKELLEGDIPPFFSYTGLSELPSAVILGDDASQATPTAERSTDGVVTLFYRIWDDMMASNGSRLRPNTTSHRHRISLEAQLARADIRGSLERMMDMCSLALPEVRASSLPSGWERVKQALVHATEAGLVNISHINKALSEFSRLQIDITATMTMLRPSASPEEIASWVDMLLSVDGKQPGTLVRELYDALWWNSVKYEIAQLQADAQTTSSLPETPIDDGPMVSLLGTPLAPSVRPDRRFFWIMTTYHAAVEGDFEATSKVLDDFRSFESESTGGLPQTLPLSDGMYHALFKGFALHGVPFARAEEGPGPKIGDPTRCQSITALKEQWYPLESVVTSSHPNFQWNVVHLLGFVEEYLALPTDGRSLSPTEQELGVSVASAVVKEAPSSKGLLRSACCPTPRELFFIVTALRRCMGDAHDDQVLDVFRRIRAKFDCTTVDHSQPHDPYSVSPWTHPETPRWKLDKRMERLLSFLEVRKRTREA